LGRSSRAHLGPVSAQTILRGDRDNRQAPGDNPRCRIRPRQSVVREDADLRPNGLACRMRVRPRWNETGPPGCRAADPAHRAFRSRLAAGRESCPLFDVDQIRRHVEAAFTTMHERYCAVSRRSILRCSRIHQARATACLKFHRGKSRRPHSRRWHPGRCRWWVNRARFAL
jgi:hypothetical protein